MNFIYLIDPIETLNLKKDTSYALMTASQERGHNVYYLKSGNIILKDNRISFQVERFIPLEGASSPYKLESPIEISGDECDLIFIRTDPPFDLPYLTNTWMLDLLPDSALVVNDANGLRCVNEKLWVNHFPALIPETIITTRIELFQDFLNYHGKVIIKPTDGFSGASIFLIHKNDTNANVAFETVSENFTKFVIVQKYVDASEYGDKRILLLDGEPIGVLNRLHRPGDHRNNFAKGASAQHAEITERDRFIIETLKPSLKDLKIYFAGIDIIGDYLIEINVTSPTCLVEMSSLMGEKLDLKVIEFLEKKIESIKL
jgi:glutathione synthase